MLNLDEQVNNKCNMVYSITESKIKQFYELIDFYSSKSKFIEIRIDYMLSTGLSIEYLINLINIVKDNYKDNLFFATIKIKEDGGFLETTPSKYFNIIKNLYQNSKADFIEVKYSYYIQDKNIYDNLFSEEDMNKALILSYYDNEKYFNDDNYELILDDMIEQNKFQIISFNNYAYSSYNLFKLMQFGSFYKNKIKKSGKYAYFITSGKIGVLSRVWFEFTNSKFVFINTDDITTSGNYPINYEKYSQLRKIIRK